MSEPQEKGNEQKDSTEVLSHFGEIIKTNTKLYVGFSEYALRLSARAEKRAERLERSENALDNALIDGAINEEEATERLRAYPKIIRR
jgi:hypothetical protein